MGRLPAVKGLAAKLSGRAGKSVGYLAAHANDFAKFSSVETLAFAADPDLAGPAATEKEIRSAKALVHHLVEVRAAIARELWSIEIFVSTEILDELLFHVIRSGAANPALACLERVRDANMNRPGLLVFPVHTFGILGAGLLRPFRQASLSIVNTEYGYALTPQTNSLPRTIKFLEDVGSLFGVRKRVPSELIEHWFQSRSAIWLERNPLVVVRAVQLPGSYYANEGLLLNRMSATVGLISLLAALQPSVHDSIGGLFSTNSINNFETLDIHHYLTLYDAPAQGAVLAGDCVPIHAGRVEVSELSSLGFELNPRHWGRNHRIADRVHEAVDLLYKRQLNNGVRHLGPNARTRTVEKVFRSLEMFRRSYHRSATDWTGKVALATAFEMLLTDSYGNVRNTLVRRSQILLRGARGTRGMQEAVGDLYIARSEFVHGAPQDATVDLAVARRAYALCFVELVQRLDGIPRETGTPIGDIVG